MLIRYVYDDGNYVVCVYLMKQDERGKYIVDRELYRGHAFDIYGPDRMRDFFPGYEFDEERV